MISLSDDQFKAWISSREIKRVKTNIGCVVGSDVMELGCNAPALCLLFSRRGLTFPMCQDHLKQFYSIYDGAVV